MTNEEILAILRAAPDVGSVKHEEFLAYALVLPYNVKVGKDKWEKRERVYFPVVGKLAMCVVDHLRQDKKWQQYPAELIQQNGETITLQIRVDSEVYGTRYGIATSRPEAGGAEASNPWETGETSALGRALSGWGYGLLPGTGRSSADDIEREHREQEPEARENSKQTPSKGKTPRAEYDGYPHWISHPDVRPRFWAKATDLILSREDVHQALHGLASVSEFNGTMREALELLEAYAKHKETERREQQRKEGENVVPISGEQIPF